VQVNGQILAQYGSGAWAYALPDHLGSVSQLSNAGGQVILYAAKALRNGG